MNILIVILDFSSKSNNDTYPPNPPVFPIKVPHSVLNPSKPLFLIFKNYIL